MRKLGVDVHFEWNTLGIAKGPKVILGEMMQNEGL